MNKDILKGQWKQLRGRVKQAWGALSDDEIDQIEGRQDELIGKLQEKYGYTRMEAEKEVERFVKELDRGM